MTRLSDTARLRLGLHEGPEAVWPELRRLWCEEEPAHEDYLFRISMLETLLDLMSGVSSIGSRSWRRRAVTRPSICR